MGSFCDACLCSIFFFLFVVFSFKYMLTLTGFFNTQVTVILKISSDFTSGFLFLMHNYDNMGGN